MSENFFFQVHEEGEILNSLFLRYLHVILFFYILFLIKNGFAMQREAETNDKN